MVIIATSTVVTADSTEPAERVQVEPSLNDVNDYFDLSLNYNLKSTLKVTRTSKNSQPIIIEPIFNAISRKSYRDRSHIAIFQTTA